MRRALPSLAAALVVAALLAAVVAASPERAGHKRPPTASGPLALMGERPTDLAPELQRYEPPAAPQPPQPANPSPPLEPVRALAPDKPRVASRAIGRPWRGRLEYGVPLAPSGVGFFTFDSALRRSPGRAWRRWGTDLNVARTTAILADFHRAHPDGPRVGVGDLSRPRGGPFGREYGGLGHASHQNGQDVDLYYPRKDRKEIPPVKPSQVDRRLSQELVDRFVAAGAELVFVGPRVGLTGPRGVVSKLAHHDDHVHVRWPKR